jgi:hypothetical protein
LAKEQTANTHIKLMTIEHNSPNGYGQVSLNQLAESAKEASEQLQTMQAGDSADGNFRATTTDAIGRWDSPLVDLYQQIRKGLGISPLGRSQDCVIWIEGGLSNEPQRHAVNVMLVVRFRPWIQPVDATDWLNRSAGGLQSSLCENMH